MRNMLLIINLAKLAVHYYEYEQLYIQVYSTLDSSFKSLTNQCELLYFFTVRQSIFQPISELLHFLTVYYIPRKTCCIIVVTC